jgi:hypothetical protein
LLHNLDFEPPLLRFFCCTQSGLAKRFSGVPKYSLQLIMARLPKGAATTISMAFLVMCAEKILRLLCLFLVAIYGWFRTWYRVGELWLAPENISPLEPSESLVTV